MEKYDYEVSMIIPTHNSEQFIKSTINSLINQKTEVSYEIIVISDSNKENNTNKILEEYKQKYSFFSYKKVNFRSAMFSKMEGVKLAKGRYISFLDSDDKDDENFIEVMYKTITKYDADVVNCYPYIVTKDRIIKYPFRKTMIMNNYKGVKHLFLDVYVRSFMHTKLYKASLLKEVSGNLKYKMVKNYPYQDILLNYLIYKKAKLIINIKDLLVFYNKNVENSVSSSSTVSQDMVNVSAFILRDILKDNDQKLLKIFSHYYLRKKLLVLYVLKHKSFKTKQDKKAYKKNLYKQLKNIYKKHQLLASDSYNEYLNIVSYRED